MRIRPETDELNRYLFTKFDMPIPQHHREMLYTALMRVPAGKVITYGDLARRAGLVIGKRIVGRLLSQLPADGNLP